MSPGTNNSSTTRVVPVFDALLESDPTGSTWIDRLLALGSRAEVCASLPSGQQLVAGHAARWGRHEASLPAPRSLLEHLVRNLDADLVANSKDSGSVREKRERLAAKDEATIEEALRALSEGRRATEWHVLEGPSRPDALLETSELVVCIEGKRTEKACTTSTTWMKTRSQLLRHMDAAMEKYPSTRVLGLLVVEGDGGADATRPSGHWIQQSRNQYSSEMLASSLPHRSATEREQMGRNILGVTTWQAVCREFGLSWSELSS